MHVTDQRLHTPWQLKLYTKLVGLQYKIVYKPGSSNLAADALSHHPAQLNATSLAQPAWLRDVINSYATDPSASKLLQELSVSPDAHPPFSLTDGVIRMRGRIWLGNNEALQRHVIGAFHSSALGGHSGFPVTFSRLKKLFAWRGMKQAVKEFVRACSTRAQAKPDHAKYPGLLSPLPVPTESWQMISMDFIEGLPRSSAANCLLVVVDRFSKFAHVIPLSHPFTAHQVVQLFLDTVYRLHGMPTHIVSDRNRVFTSTFWRELFRLAQTQLCMSSAYHPQSDGQTERVNQCLETYLRCFVHSCPKNWIKWISLAEFWYNTSFHTSLRRSPFEASVRQHLHRAQHRMKSQADKNRFERSFNTGDLVYLKLQPYVQASLAPRAHQKLSFRYFGPYKVLERVGSVAYKLQLPPTSTVHPVFHVSLLKPVHTAKFTISSNLPDVDDNMQIPEAVLQRRLHQRGDASVPQALIKWTGLDTSLATWEDEQALRQQFPGAPAWGQAGTQGGGDVTVPHLIPSPEVPGPRRGARV